MTDPKIPDPRESLSLNGISFMHQDLFDVVDDFYTRIQLDPVLSIPFLSVHDWPEHITRLTHFWWVRFGGAPYLFNSYNPVAKHFFAGFNDELLERWLALFHETLRCHLNEEQTALWSLVTQRMGQSLLQKNEMYAASQPATARWQNSEQRFSLNDYRGADDGPLIEFADRSSPLLLCALHGVSHFAEDGGPKVPDIYTGGLVASLGAETRTSHLVNLRCSLEINPHTGTPPAYKVLRDYLAKNPHTFVLDVHGAKNTETFDAAIGLGVEAGEASEDQAAFRQKVEEAGLSTGVRTAVNVPGYSALGAKTLTHFVLSLGHTRILQLELTRDMREPTSPLAERSLQFLKKIVETCR